MDLSNKIVLAHRGHFSKVSENDYRENSKEVCEISSKKEHISIIELDVRKSKDGILYCYHGGPLYYFLTSRVSQNFSDIKKRYEVDSLSDIVSVITEDKSVFLDIKDKTITKEDVLEVLGDKKFKEVILGNKSISYLDRFSDMPSEYVKILNGDVFCNFRSLENLKSNNYKYFEVVFPFQINSKTAKRVKDSGLELRSSCVFFRNKEKYLRMIEKYEIEQISSDFI